MVHFSTKLLHLSDKFASDLLLLLSPALAVVRRVRLRCAHRQLQLWLAPSCRCRKSESWVRFAPRKIVSLHLLSQVHGCTFFSGPRLHLLLRSTVAPSSQVHGCAFFSGPRLRLLLRSTAAPSSQVHGCTLFSGPRLHPLLRSTVAPSSQVHGCTLFSGPRLHPLLRSTVAPSSQVHGCTLFSGPL